VLQLDPKNVAASRIMAETAELAGKRDALSWRQQLVALEPGVAANQIALASAAMRFGQFDLARKTLDAVDAAGRVDGVERFPGKIELAETHGRTGQRDLVRGNAGLEGDKLLAPGKRVTFSRQLRGLRHDSTGGDVLWIEL